MSEQQLKFNALYPDVLYLEKQNLDVLPDYLKSKGYIGPDEHIELMEKPGEGNMNFVYRIRTQERSFIIKQSRPWVEKYPQIEAPIERIHVEALFYELLLDHAFFRKYIPALTGYDKDNFVLITEDLGDSADYTFVYHLGNEMAEEALISLLQLISRLHNSDFSQHRATFPSNLPLKKLNHEHIFIFPYMDDNGFDLDYVQQGLQAISLPFKNNEALIGEIQKLGEIYLSSGATLIHGDYYPGSWLKTSSGPKVIDPEFAHFGAAEFDMGVMAAHLKMARFSDQKIADFMQYYQQPEEYDATLYKKFIGVEILRRIIGLAQLPLDLTLYEKQEMLQWAQQIILSPQQISTI